MFLCILLATVLSTTEPEWTSTLQSHLEVYQSHPDDPTPLYEIAHHYRLAGKYDMAYMFAKRGSLLPKAGENHLIDEEISVCAYYTLFHEDGYAATDRLILRKGIPQESKDQAYRNMLFYVQKLKNAKYIPISIKLPPTRAASLITFRPMNPSIMKAENGYTVICRTVNYAQDGGRNFRLIDAGDKTNRFRTRNYLLQYDKKLHLISQKEIVEDIPRTHYKWWNAEGIEDCRLFKYKGDTWVTCTTCDTNPTGYRQMSLCKLPNDKSGDPIFVEQLTPLIGPNPKRCEKNWLPVVREGEIHLIYSYDPFVVFKPDLKTGECPTAIEKETASDFRKFRGSAAPIPFDEGYLMLVHETVELPNFERRYMHRFVYMDNDLDIKKMSRPFVFRNVGVEFCAGMTIDHASRNLIMPIGVEDRDAYLCVVSLNTVRSLLRVY